MKHTKKIKIGSLNIGGSGPLVLIAGPCVIESEKITLEIARKLKTITSKVGIPLIFKASYDKANRTSIKSFRGTSIDNGLRILKKIKKELNIPVLTDVHCVKDVGKAAEVVDIVQIPAFLCRQTDLLTEAGKKAKCVNIKKGQFLAPWDIKYVVEKVTKTKNRNILITERGTSFGYNQLVTDMCSLPEMRRFGFPVIFDVTHSLQSPGGLGKSSGGRVEYVPDLSRAAVACGCDGIFMEVHTNPKKALSDSKNSFPLNKLEDLLKDLVRIDKIVKK